MTAGTDRVEHSGSSNPHQHHAEFYVHFASWIRGFRTLQLRMSDGDDRDSHSKDALGSDRLVHPTDAAPLPPEGASPRRSSLCGTRVKGDGGTGYTSALGGSAPALAPSLGSGRLVHLVDAACLCPCRMWALPPAQYVLCGMGRRRVGVSVSPIGITGRGHDCGTAAARLGVEWVGAWAWALYLRAP